MTSKLQSTVKYIGSIFLTVAIVAGGIYAANITNLTQTANSGDTLTHQWVNAVNTASVGAAGTYSISCSMAALGILGAYTIEHTCVRFNNISGASECKERSREDDAIRWTPWKSCDNGAPSGCMDALGDPIACPPHNSNPW